MDCKKARQWLDDHEIEVVEINVEEYPEAKQKVRNYTGGDIITPTFDIRGEIIIDYDIAALEKVFQVK
jgi:glutaredoxin